MGGADPEDEQALCSGDDVLTELNDAFSDPNCAEYMYARTHNAFWAVDNAPGNYNDLIAAYTIAHVPVSKMWAAYLKHLGELVPQGPQNIYKIAQARNDGLTRWAAMSTKTHPPKNGGHVHTSGVGVGSITIDSPYSHAIFRKMKP